MHYNKSKTVSYEAHPCGYEGLHRYILLRRHYVSKSAVMCQVGEEALQQDGSWKSNGEEAIKFHTEQEAMAALAGDKERIR